MRLTVRRLPATPGGLEIVERKGLGHPDTLCDAVAEALSRRLCRLYLAETGHILHHNVDKVLLRGGASDAAFGGGALRAPIEVYVAGRATVRWEGRRLPVGAEVEAAVHEVFAAAVPALDTAWLRVHDLLREGSADLRQVFGRAGRRANDTSCGVAWWPLSPLERAVLAVERGLSAPSPDRPWMGTDVKVMGVRDGDRVELTVAAALIGGALADLDDYLGRRAEVAARARALAVAAGVVPASVTVNAGDDDARGSVYLTVTGTSAEAGDDGEVGRGNRTNGLIAPMRPMTLEAAAGKNPATHVGKLYHLVAERAARRVVERVPGVAEAACWMVSRIGAPVDEPWAVDLALGLADGVGPETVAAAAEAEVRAALGEVDAVTAALVAGTVSVY